MLSGLAHPIHRYSEAYYADYITKRPLHRQPVHPAPAQSREAAQGPFHDQASRFTPAPQTSELASYYSVNQGRPQLPPLSKQTQQALDQIKSIVGNELKTYRANLRAQAEKELGRKLAPDEKLGDLGIHDRMALSSETRKAEATLFSSYVWSQIATVDMESPHTVSLTGPDAMDLSKEELADKVIRDGVETQINAMKYLAKRTTTETYQKFASAEDAPARSFPPLTRETEDQIRTDLLAYRRAQYERGELDITVQVFSSQHAFNYGQPHKVFDMAAGEMTVNEENRAEFRNDWEMSQSDRDHYLRGIEHFGEARYMNEIKNLGKSQYKDEVLKDIYM